MRGRPRAHHLLRGNQAPLGTRRPSASGSRLFLVFLLILPCSSTVSSTPLMATAFLSAIGAIGLNLVTGWAGQVSLGHAFFLGVGAYTGAVVAAIRTAS